MPVRQFSADTDFELENRIMLAAADIRKQRLACLNSLPDGSGLDDGPPGSICHVVADSPAVRALAGAPLEPQGKIAETPEQRQIRELTDRVAAMDDRLARRLDRHANLRHELVARVAALEAQTLRLDGVKVGTAPYEATVGRVARLEAWIRSVIEKGRADFAPEGR